MNKYALWTGYSLSLMPSVQDFAQLAWSQLALYALSASAAAGIGSASVQLSNLSLSAVGADKYAAGTVTTMGWEAAGMESVKVSAPALSTWSMEVIPSPDDWFCRAFTLCVGLVAVLRMRRDERNYPKDFS